MTKFEMVKAVGEMIVSVGVGAIVGNAIKATTPNNVGRIKKVCITIGGMVLGSMAGDCATKYTGQKIDEAATKFRNMVQNKNWIDV